MNRPATTGGSAMPVFTTLSDEVRASGTAHSASHVPIGSPMRRLIERRGAGDREGQHRDLDEVAASRRALASRLRRSPASACSPCAQGVMRLSSDFPRPGRRAARRTRATPKVADHLLPAGDRTKSSNAAAPAALTFGHLPG